MELSLVRILSDQFAARHNDATVQPELESGKAKPLNKLIPC